MKKLLFRIFKIIFQFLLVGFLCSSFTALISISYFVINDSSLIPTYIDSSGQSNLTSNGWLIYFIGHLFFLYPFRKFKLIYAELFCIIGASLILPLLIYGTVYVETDGELITQLLSIIFVPILYYEKTYNSYKLKKLFKFNLVHIPIPNRLFIFLLNHKKKVFYASIIILLITIVNFTDEVILGGQGLFLSPEELFGWIVGFFLGIGGLVFLKKNNYFKKPKP